MKKLLFGICVLFSSIVFSPQALAEVWSILEGSGSTADAVKAFDKAVASNGGTVDNNAKTEVASAGDFGKYKAQMYSEVGSEGKVKIKIVVKLKEADLIAFLTVQANVEMEVAKKIQKSMIESGYHEGPQPAETK